jgi:hypothetical protein
MQLTAQGGNMVVDFYPEAIIAEEGVNRFVKVVTFMPNSDKPVKSFSTITKLTFKHEIAERLASGYDVTDFHTERFEGYNGFQSAC